jgi:hypothetical protein
MGVIDMGFSSIHRVEPAEESLDRPDDIGVTEGLCRRGHHSILVLSCKTGRATLKNRWLTDGRDVSILSTVHLDENRTFALFRTSDFSKRIERVLWLGIVFSNKRSKCPYDWIQSIKDSLKISLISLYPCYY